MSAPIAAPLMARTVAADGLTFTARQAARGTVVRTACPIAAGRLAVRPGWTLEIDSRPERAAVACQTCGGAHR